MRIGHWESCPPLFIHLVHAVGVAKAHVRLKINFFTIGEAKIIIDTTNNKPNLIMIMVKISAWGRHCCSMYKETEPIKAWISNTHNVSLYTMHSTTKM